MKNFADEKNTYRYLIVVSKIKQSFIIQSQPGLSSVYTVCAKYWGPDTRHQTSCCQLQTAAAAGPPLSLTLISTPSKQYSGWVSCSDIITIIRYFVSQSLTENVGIHVLRNSLRMMQHRNLSWTQLVKYFGICLIQKRLHPFIVCLTSSEHLNLSHCLSLVPFSWHD